MSDISKCDAETEKGLCPLRLNCYRYIAKADEVLQSYIKAPYDHKNKICAMFWETKTRVK